MTIYSCRYCTPPKRYPGCHANCPEYLADKAKHDEPKAANDKKRAVEGEIYHQRDDRVYKAKKRSRRRI